MHVLFNICTPTYMYFVSYLSNTMARMNSIENIAQVRLLVLPNLEPYLQLLEPEMQLEKQKNEMKRHEAWLVYGALMVRYAL